MLYNETYLSVLYCIVRRPCCCWWWCCYHHSPFGCQGYFTHCLLFLCCQMSIVSHHYNDFKLGHSAKFNQQLGQISSWWQLSPSKGASEVCLPAKVWEGRVEFPGFEATWTHVFRHGRGGPGTLRKRKGYHRFIGYSSEIPWKFKIAPENIQSQKGK